MARFLQFDRVSFAYPGMAEPLLAEAPCALLLVSHDERFLARLTTVRWSLVQDGDIVRFCPLSSVLGQRTEDRGQRI